MTRKRNYLRGVVTIVATAAVSVGMLTSCASMSSWTPTNISTQGAIERIACDQLRDARDTKSRAVYDHDTEAQEVLGISGFTTQQLQEIDVRFTAAQTACDKASSTTSAPSSSSASPTSTKKHEVVAVASTQGVQQQVPFSANVQIQGSDTRNNLDLPSIHRLLPNCEVWTDWDDVVQCVNANHAQWYRDGINALHAQGKLSFTWNDIETWAKVRTPSGAYPESRAIVVHKWTEGQKPKDVVRAEAAKLVGADAAKNMEVLYLASPFLNTWKKNQPAPAIEEFADYNQQIRVTLMPLKFNEVTKKWEQNPSLINGMLDGIFVDCYNIHGHLYIPPKPGEPLVCPQGTPLAGQPIPMGGCTPSGGGEPVCKVDCVPKECKIDCTPKECKVNCNPCTKDCGPEECKVDCVPKIPGQDPGPQGQAPDGNGGNQDSGPGESRAPEVMTPPPSVPRVDPPAPAPAPVPEATPEPSFTPPAPATGAAPPTSAGECAPVPGMPNNC